MPVSKDPILSEQRAIDAVERQALAWVRKVAAGDMTHADGIALKKWCQSSPSHATAFSRARVRWKQMGQAGEELVAANPSITHAPVPAPEEVRMQRTSRRLFLGGVLGTSLAAAGVVAVTAPLGLWPGVDEWGADYRTGTGESRQLLLADSVQVVLDTRTSISVWKGQENGVDLLAGQVAVDARGLGQPFVVSAAGGMIGGTTAQFDVRYTPKGICVTCLAGQVQVRHAANKVVLQPSQQLFYSQQAMGQVMSVDYDVAFAWRSGYLRFVDTPLGDVIEEINRYRAGHIMLTNRALADKAVNGRFSIGALDKALAQILYSLNLKARSLPGNVLLLG